MSKARTLEPTAFLVLCRDSEQGSPARAAATPRHLAYIETVMDELQVAGPFFDPESGATLGSLYCLRTKSVERARELIENDPYFEARVWKSVEYVPFLPAAGAWIGGKIW